MTEQDKDNTALPVVQDEAPEQEVTDTAADSVSAAEPSDDADNASAATKPVLKTGWLVSLAVLIALLAALSAGGWWLWQQVQTELNALVSEQQRQQAEQQQFQSQLREQMLGLQQQAQQVDQNWQGAYNELEALVVSSAQRLNRQANRTEQRWPLEEALTLTRLAQQRLQLDSSARVALGLLAAADKILAAQDQAAVLPIRRQFASDILALESAASVDINGAYFELAAIADAVQAFSWVPKPTLSQAMAEDAELAEGFWHSLKQVVVISRQEVPYQAPALQSDFEQWRQQLLLLIEQTQLALLAHNQPLYDSAIAQSQQRLAIMASQFNTQVLDSKLSVLAQAQLNPVWPDIQLSISAIEQYLAEQAEPVAESDAAETSADTEQTQEVQQ